MKFEWEEDKREKTIQERGIDFVDAAKVWDDPLRQERVDRRENYGEVRIQTIGRVHFGILFVVYTERSYDDGEEVIHIISARKADKRERREYETMTFSARYIG
ncbi:MAG: BrnT family toxin [Gammaproteobacteria bacterium]|nr:BrnT family toxin [Gammaproteobacteria bacterium]